MTTCCRLGLMLATVTLVGSAVGTPPRTPVFNEYGIETDPICSYAMPEALHAMHKQVPSGERAQTAEWKLEVYAKSTGASWTLVGTRIGPDEDEDEMCHLANGLGDYRTQKWYRVYFLPRK